MVLQTMLDNYYDNDTLESLLIGTSSDELISKYISLSKILVDNGFINHLDVLELLDEQVISLNFDRLNLPLEVDDILREASRVSLLECGITFDEDIPLDLIIELTDYVVGFDITEDPQYLLDTIETSEDYLGCFTDLISDYTGRNDFEWLEVITRVDIGLIERIKSLCLESLTEVLDESYIEGMSKRDMLEKSGDLGDVLPELTREEVDISMESLLKNNLDILDGLSLEDSVRRIWSYGCLSSETFNEANVKVSNIIDDYYMDPRDSLNAKMYSNKIKNDFEEVFWR